MPKLLSDQQLAAAAQKGLTVAYELLYNAVGEVCPWMNERVQGVK